MDQPGKSGSCLGARKKMDTWKVPGKPFRYGILYDR